MAFPPIAFSFFNFLASIGNAPAEGGYGSSQRLRRALQASMTEAGVVCLFFENTSRIRISLGSMRYMRQVAFSSWMRSS